MNAFDLVLADRKLCSGGEVGPLLRVPPATLGLVRYCG